jgi:hypothetical protein
MASFEIGRQLDRRGQVGALVSVQQTEVDDGVLPVDQPFAVLQRQMGNAVDLVLSGHGTPLSAGQMVILSSQITDSSQ